LPKFK